MSLLAGKLMLGVLLLVAAGTDLASRRIPNQIIFIGLGAFFLQAVWSLSRGNATMLGGCLAAGILAFGIHFIPYLLRNMGAGDVKLALVMGLLLGWQDWLDYMGAYCIVLLVASGVLLALGKRKPKSLPLAPFMAAAFFLSWVVWVLSTEI